MPYPQPNASPLEVVTELSLPPRAYYPEYYPSTLYFPPIYPSVVSEIDLPPPHYSVSLHPHDDLPLYPPISYDDLYDWRLLGGWGFFEEGGLRFFLRRGGGLGLLEVFCSFFIVFLFGFFGVFWRLFGFWGCLEGFLGLVGIWGFGGIFRSGAKGDWGKLEFRVGNESVSWTD